ncbi:MAG: zinc-ribbon domain-containing protein [Polyangiaceae bacterium]
MKIACQSCQAKYTIADEKVVGKIVKIRCKKCGATIVINGNDPEATNPLPAGEGGSEWTVNVAEGDQRTMTSEEIIDGYRGGVVTDETFCWKDGMADWLPLREIDELYQAVSSGSNAADAGGADFAPLSMRGSDDQATVPLQREQMGGIFSGMGSGHAESNGNGASLFSGGAAPAPSPSSPPAARRVGGRAGGADLFGGAATAGGEDDVMTSAPSGSGGGNHAAANEEPGKLTGQRNENSVLFSLNALTSSGPKVEKEKPTADGSGLIDIRALSSSMAADTGKKRDHVDDIMNLGGGGAFNAPLAAPILAPPLAGADVTDGGTPVADKQKKMLMMIIGGFGVIILLFMGIVIYFVTRTPKIEDPTAGGREALSGSAAAGGTAAPTDSSAVAANTGAATASAAPTTGGALPPGTGAVAQNNTPPATHGGGGGGGGSHTTTHTDTPSTPPATGGGGGGGGGTDLMSAMNAASPGVKPTGGGGGGGGGGTAPFDRGAAAGSLGGIASSLGSCKKGDGPTGSGHAQITFSPSGNVKAVDVDAAPFAGSSVGGCVAAKFRAAHVPAFSGGDVKVGKSFQIN